MMNLSELRRDTNADLCLACGKCTTMCPLAAHGDFSARRIASQSVEPQIATVSPAIGRCLTCGSCEVRCPQGVRITEYVRGLRGFVQPDMRPPQPHGGMFAAAAQLGPTHRTFEWLEDDLRVAESGEVALFVGCLPLFDAAFAGKLGVNTLATANAAIRLLNRQGIEPVLAAQERCCGHDLLWTGELDAFEELARANADTFSKLGVKRIVSVCAECTRTWRMDYPEVVPSYKPAVQHVAEFLAEKAEDLEWEADAVPAERPRLLTYQDPCRLGRHLGVYDAPRRLIGSLPDTQLVEMNRSGKDALCCGTSGFIHCDAFSRRLQAERLESAESTGADVLITSCPKCLIHFTCSKHADERNGTPPPAIELMDLTVLLASHLRREETTPEDSPVLVGGERGETR